MSIYAIVEREAGGEYGAVSFKHLESADFLEFMEDNLQYDKTLVITTELGLSKLIANGEHINIES